MPSTLQAQASFLQVEALEDRSVPSAFGFVTGLYTDLLNRIPRPEEVAGWVTAMERGASPEQVALGFTQGQEFRTNLIRLNYENLLDREPADSELVGWLNLLNQGLREDRFQAEILSSAEYLLKQGNTLVTWLNGMYVDVLNRPIDPTGLRFWLSQLQIGARPTAVALGIVFSQEAHLLVVGGTYQSLLGRLPDPQGITIWVTALDQGLTLAQLLAKIGSSQEYIDRTADGDLNGEI